MEEYLINEKKTKFIGEITAEDDLFLDRSHEKIAKSLAEIIRDSERPFRVGLQGAWGAGKSSIVKQLGKFLQDNDSEIFIFDAWAHEGDPLKRIFLESLAVFLEEKNLKSENGKGNQEVSNDLSEFKLEISGRRSTEETVSIKEATNFTKLLSFSAMTIPVGSAIFNKIKIEEIGFPDVFSEKPVHWIFILVILLWLYPLILTLVFKICKLETELFSSKSEEIVTKNSLKSLDATSIEFEVYFKKLLRIANLKLGINKLIIVIDNIDRLEVSKAKEVFSAMQNFFFVKFDESEIKSNLKLWFLIPFDQTILGKIWDMDVNNQNDFPVFQSMLKKNFQLIIDVPLPRTSGWVEYTKEKLIEVFGEEDKDLIDLALNAYTDFLSNSESVPKPRDINSFVNQLVMLQNLNKNVGIESLCWYVCMRESKTTSKIHSDLLSMNIDYKGGVERAEFVADLAAILFCVDPKNSIEILLRDEISKIAESGEIEKFGDLYSRHGDAFLHACKINKEKWMILRSDKLIRSYRWTNGYIDFYLSNKDVFGQGKLNILEYVIEFWGRNIKFFDLGSDDYSKIVEFILSEMRASNDKYGDFANSLREKIAEETSLISANEYLFDVRIKNWMLIAREISRFGLGFDPIFIDDKRKNLWLSYIKCSSCVEDAPILMCLDRVFFKSACYSVFSEPWNESKCDFVVDSYKFDYSRICGSEYEFVWGDLVFLREIDFKNLNKKIIYFLIIIFNLPSSLVESFSYDVRDIFKSRFLSIGDNENVKLISLLAVLVFGESLFLNENIDPAILRFWENKLSEDDLQVILRDIYELNLMSKILKYTKDSNSELVLQLREVLEGR